MPHLPDHQTHDPELVAAYAAGDATGAALDEATALVAGCADCAELHRDLRAIAAALPELPAPARPRDFRLTAEQAASLRPHGWRALLETLAGPRFRLAAPLGTGLAALGIAALLVAPGGLPATGSGSAASVPESSAVLPGPGALASAAGAATANTAAGAVPAAGAAPAGAAPAASAGPASDDFGAAEPGASAAASAALSAPVALPAASVPVGSAKAASTGAADQLAIRAAGGASASPGAGARELEVPGPSPLVSEPPGPGEGSPWMIAAVLLVASGLALVAARLLARGVVHTR